MKRVLIAAAVLSLTLLSGGNGSLGVQMFPPETAAFIKKIISDAARADAAVRVVDQARKESEATVKRAAEVAKKFKKADTDHETGLEDLQPFLESIAAERQRGQKEALDSVFALKKTLTEEEWKAVFPGPKAP